MAPGYRNQNRRHNRTGYVDHDVFEGLPVRHWRRDYVTVAPAPAQDTTTPVNDIWAVELPHGMPKDYHLLPQHSQDLLRGARSGRIYKRPAPIEEDEVDPEGVVLEKPEKKEEETKDRGFSAKAWKQVPRHLEGPDLEYLSKRKKNIIPKGGKPKPVPTVTKATMKNMDAAGNEYVQDVIIPHGQQVEGEIISQTEIPDPSAIEPAIPVQPSPVKRKSSSKKKLKGPGRGRKKQKIAPTSVPAQGELTAESQPLGIKTESDGSVPPTQNEDTDMNDISAAASENDDSDEEDGDDDEGSVESDSPVETPRLDSDLPPIPSPPSLHDIPDLLQEDTPMREAHVPPRPPLHLDDKPKSGSPLKHVALSSSALASPYKEPKEEIAPVPTEVEKLDVEMQEETAGVAPSPIAEAPPALTDEIVEAAVELRKEEEQEEEMLLDILEKADAHDPLATLDAGSTEFSNEVAGQIPEESSSGVADELFNEVSTLPAYKPVDEASDELIEQPPDEIVEIPTAPVDVDLEPPETAEPGAEAAGENNEQPESGNVEVTSEKQEGGEENQSDARGETDEKVEIPEDVEKVGSIENGGSPEKAKSVEEVEGGEQDQAGEQDKVDEQETMVDQGESSKISEKGEGTETDVKVENAAVVQDFPDLLGDLEKSLGKTEQ